MEALAFTAILRNYPTLDAIIYDKEIHADDESVMTIEMWLALLPPMY